MTKIIVAVYILLLGMFSSATALAQEPYEPVLYYQIANGDSSFAEVQQQSMQRWRSTNGEASFGYTSDIYWFRFAVPASAQARVMNISYPLLDQVDIYIMSEDGLMREYQVGDKKPFSERPVKHKDFVIPLPTSEPLTIFMRVETSSSLRVPVAIWPHAEFLEGQSTGSMAAGLYYGVVICMAVYNLFGFFVSRERSFLTYSCYTIFIGLLMASLDGSGYRYIWSESIWLQDKAIPFFGAMVFMLAAIFTSQLLSLKEHSRRLNLGLATVAGVFALMFVVNLFLPYAIVIKMLLALAVPGCLFLLGTGIYLWRRGHVYARVFTLAWATLLLAIITNSLGYLGLIDGFFIQRYAIMIGSGIEILLLSWVLAIRYTEERRQKLVAQSEALQRAEEMQVAQEEQNEQLEEKVAERTFELEIAMRELQEANAELEQKSSEDALTGIYNRRFLNRQLETEFRRSYRQQSSLSMVMLDIDHFKPVNDTHGHLVGDQILVQLAELLKRQLRRASDTLCRYGGEEFAILLPNTDLEGAEAIARHLSEAVRNHSFDTEAGPIQITVSMGVAEARPCDFAVAEQLLAHADKALYKAKNSGRDQVCPAPTERVAVASE
ncbi:diguanylate cyclase (GGDEF) domain-containing protein [Pseudidiomarina planktonica]|uniref:diguanylate cyclase n=1 Tax=Pseudidiomarina planktonica TaxID=1323738 RepID=A0A1Y6FWD9_9GAMM|nr:diguanylate cyclase [Pseudidiomarina planktonica]RUO63892.1 GGDEF domain-containing protein [Pseudidiomarina planktonica]SMQ80033.1 diguanylate cyclase (GGDEF) domain-containing protein [Pseudidiomarina planktonica]